MLEYEYLYVCGGGGCFDDDDDDLADERQILRDISNYKAFQDISHIVSNSDTFRKLIRHANMDILVCVIYPSRRSLPLLRRASKLFVRNELAGYG